MIWQEVVGAAIAAIIGGAGTALALAVKYGRHVSDSEHVRKSVDLLTNDLSEIKADMANLHKLYTEMAKQTALQEERLEQVRRDHSAINIAVNTLNSNMHENTSAIVELKVTMDGIKSLMQNVLDGTVRPRRK